MALRFLRGLHTSMSASAGPVEARILSKLSTAFSPTHITVLNESHMHSVPRGSETHFKVTVVSDTFEGKSPIERHRLVNGVLAEELSTGVHALSIHARTPQQWNASSAVPQSPNCMGGMKKESA